MGIRRPVSPALRPWAACRDDVAAARSWWPGRDGAAVPAGRRAGVAGSWSPRSARRRRDAAICRAVPWPRQDHRASHDAVELDRRVAHVRVVDPHHPLYGSCLLVSDRRSGRGPDLIVVRLPDGRERSIPRVATDLVARPAGPPQVTGRQKHISVRTLLPLANHVRAVLASHHEDPTGAPLLDRPPARSSHGEREREADGIAPPVGPTPDGEATATGAAGRPACKPPAAGVAPRSGGTSC